MSEILKVFLDVQGRDIAFVKPEQSYHLTKLDFLCFKINNKKVIAKNQCEKHKKIELSMDAEAAAVRLLLPLHRKRHIPEIYFIICIYVKWH